MERIILTNENFYEHDWITNKERAHEDGLYNWVINNEALQSPSVWYKRTREMNPGCSCDEYDQVGEERPVDFDSEGRYIEEPILVYPIPLEVEEDLKNPEYKGLLDVARLRELVKDEEQDDPIEVTYCTRCKEWTIYLSL